MQASWFRDGGCCGCTKTKRRVVLILIGIICYIIGLVIYLQKDDPEQEFYQAVGLAIIGSCFVLGGIICPNACCYGNRGGGNYQRAWYVKGVSSYVGLMTSKIIWFLEQI